MKSPLPPKILIQFFILSIAMLAFTMVHAQVFKTGKGYLNITKGTLGGTFEAGDVLEVRSTFSLTSGTMGYVRYVDTLPANVSYVPGSLKLTTNEGVAYRTFTDAGNDDAGMYEASNKTLKMNAGPTVNAGAKVTSTDPLIDKTGAPWIDNTALPSFWKNTCIIVAAYRIKIDAVSVNTVINFYGGAYHYIFNNVDKLAALPAFKIKVAPNLGLCTNKVSQNSIIENGGTFGSGTAQVRATNSSLVTGYTYSNIDGNSPADGSYTIVNNSSATASTNTTVSYNGQASRVFGVWEIGGDHTQATNQTLGNAPKAQNTNAGYMLLVNASYVNGVAVSQPISNLCDDTYYEFSAWIKNVCKYCGCDLQGDGAFTNNYQTAFPGDSSGVKPNLTFAVNGEAVYTTGDIAFSGNWVKKGFIFKTAPGETNITISIRNNSSGGGGNDWAMDDLSLSICGPGIAVTPTRITDCNNNYINMAATVRYFQQNYGTYRWEKSTNGGTTWTTTPYSGSMTPTLAMDGQYEYTVSYPSFLTTQADSGSRYRVRVASNSGNLATTTCSYLDTTVASLTIFDCAVLPVELMSFTGKRSGNNNLLNWATKREVNPCSYTLERSADGSVFTVVTSINSQNLDGLNAYKFTDPMGADAKMYYRILIKDLSTGKSKYTNVVQLNGTKNAKPATINVLENPFTSGINIEVFASGDEDLKVTLCDVYGRIVRTGRFPLNAGYRKISLEGLDRLLPGFYALKLDLGNQVFTRKMIKN